jgi:hypothetical protein
MNVYEVSFDHLHYLIKTTNKIDHNLSKSDLNIYDKQNFASCQRISDDKVLNLSILVYVQSKVSLTNRTSYVWIMLFYIRL